MIFYLKMEPFDRISVILRLNFNPKNPVSSRRVFNRMFYWIYFVLFGIVIFLVILLIIRKSELYYAKILADYCVFAFLICMSLEFFRRFSSKDGKEKTVINFFFTSILVFSIIILFWAQLDATAIRYKRSSQLTIIGMKNNHILTTSDTLVYVGRSEKYIFLYDKTNNTPEIISADEIVDMKWVKNSSCKQ